MTDATEQTEGQAAEQSEAIDSGSYELLKTRLYDQSSKLAKKADGLNKQRLEVFGGTEMKVAGTKQIHTENNCVPRDLSAVSDKLLFGYNVTVGLRQETVVGDVFVLYRYKKVNSTYELEKVKADDPENCIADPRFVADFEKLQKFYRGATLTQLRDLGTRMLAVFQTGSTVRDIKAFRWDIHPDGAITYKDDNGERDHVFPPAHVDWIQTTQGDFRRGQHEHVSIKDRVFVETVGGDLTVKVEDNTQDGLGIYREPVDNADQTLEDGKILYAEYGSLILLKILPFGESEWRYLVFNTRTQAVARIDAIGKACVALPEDHGIIFPGGYYLQSGETKMFEGVVEGMIFQREVRSPNGEDVLYVFYEQSSGRTILLPYNIIRKEVQNPIHCHGYGLFDDGMMLVFREQDEPLRVHQMQIWDTAFMSDVFAAAHAADGEHADSFLTKVGNADLVRGISDCLSVRRSVVDQEPSSEVYAELVGGCTRLLDAHFWLGDEAVDNIAATIKDIRGTAELIIDEFQKVLAIQKASKEALETAEKDQEKLIFDIKPSTWHTVDPFVAAMGKLRGQRGKLITLNEMRYIDTARIDALEQEVIESFEKLTEQAVKFLLADDALKPYHDKNNEVMAQIEAVKQSTDAIPIQEELDTTSTNLDMLSEVIGGLQIDDPAARTRILEGIVEVFALINRAKATLAGKRKDLLSAEGVAEFGAQFKLFAQSVQSAIALADTPEKCEEQLTRLMIQLEELEARFSEFDQFLADLATKREEVYDAFNAKKQQLLDERQRRGDNIAKAADRILKGISRRASAFKAVDELNAYFASDAMILKVRDLSEQLVELGDSMRAEAVIAQLKAGRDDAARSLRDKTELFEDGANIIRLGKHRFAVNTQDLELTMLPRDEGMALHLTGTNFFELIEDPALLEAKVYWDQSLVSETREVYRGEYLAASILFDAEAGTGAVSLADLQTAVVEEKLLELVREYASSRYDEGYDRGVHDSDAAIILGKLLALRGTAGHLRFGPKPRALGCLFWAFYGDKDNQKRWKRQAENLGRLREAFQASAALQALSGELSTAIAEFLAENQIPHGVHDVVVAGSYLAEELATVEERFCATEDAVKLREEVEASLEVGGTRAAFMKDLGALKKNLPTRYAIVDAWVRAFMKATKSEKIAAYKPVIAETVVLFLSEGILDRDVSGALSAVEIKGLLGQHGTIAQQTKVLRLDEFLDRLGHYIQHHVPGYRAFRALRHDVLERQRRDLRLEEFKPRVLSSFVRNKLINDVYLHLVGDNLAKQMGAAGDQKRTDLMGMLLLISPPGYGKTTLMEYIANRLGLIFMKINGPALGHSVESLDPEEAPNATAKQEVTKLNLALEMGNNVMLYVDDIQHTNPEFLQKFISLCDAQRRIEGVWKGRTRTYDLRGRRFCVCMAGNPYTESGDKFQIPDMLANRADVYNLGDVLSGKEDAFSLSYIENAITSNPVLAPLATREQSDIYALARMAQGEDVPASDLSHNYSKVETEEMVAILKRMFRCRDVLLAVNAEYIASAAQDDRFRTEPRFQLQGSYRNMNKLAEKLVAAMNDDEIESMVDDHYMGESQTLTTGAEANILKLKELRGTLNPEEQARWDDIKSGFARHQLAGDAEEDPVTRVTKQLSALNSQVDGVRSAIEAAVEADARAPATPAPEAAVKAPAAAPDSTALTDSLLPAVNDLSAAIEKAVAAAASTKAAPRAQAQAAPATAGPDLSPYLAELNKVLGAMANASAQAAEPRPVPAAPPPATEALAPYMKQLNVVLRALAQKSGDAPELTRAADVEEQFQQVAVVRNVLRAILEEAEKGIKDKKASLSASKVWKQLSQAMELLEAIR